MEVVYYGIERSSVTDGVFGDVEIDLTGPPPRPQLYRGGSSFFCDSEPPLWPRGMLVCLVNLYYRRNILMLKCAKAEINVTRTLFVLMLRWKN